MKRALVFWVGSFVLMLTAGYVVWNASTRRAYSAQELSEEQAVAAANRFLQVCELAPASAPRRARLRTGSGGWQFWEISWPGQYTCRIDARTGQVYLFSNYARVYEQVKRIGRERAPRIASQEAAEQYCWELARRLGLPKDAYLKSLRITKEGGAGDANRAASISAVFDVRYFGYAFLSDGGEISITIDPLDGTLTYFSRRLDTMIESHDVRLSKSEAVQKAKQVYEGWYRTRRSPHRGQYAGRVEVGYVYPNSNFGRKASPPQVPYRARLAYAVYFGEEAVWIDAANGSLLGGRLLK